MLCDELKVYVPQDGPYGLEPEEGGKLVEEETCYLKSEVDAAIAELKDKCQMHDFFWEGCGFAKRGFKNAIAVSEAFDRLEAENAELKKKLEDAKASHYAEMVDAGMSERKLARNVWHRMDEELPDVDEYVICYGGYAWNGRGYSMLKIATMKGPFGCPLWTDGSGEPICTDEITHWMYLPKPPKEEK